MFVLSIVSFSLVAAALALPQHARQSGSCANVGSSAFDNATNFTLGAVGTSSPTPIPLVLGQSGAIDGASFAVLSTFASYPYDTWSHFNMTNGELLPISLNGEAVSVADTPVTAGDELGWIFTTEDLPPPAQIYCAIANTDSEGGPSGLTLAVNDDANGFSLCNQYGQVNVVYEASPHSYEYDYGTCTNVTVVIIESD